MTDRVSQEIQSGRPASSPAVEFVLNVYRTYDRLLALQRATLQPEGIAPEGYNVLRILRGAGAAGHPRSEVQARMVLPPDHFLGVAHALKQRGLIDGTLQLTITDAGRELLARIEGPLDAAFARQLEGVSAADLRTAIGVLERARDGIAPRARG